MKKGIIFLSIVILLLIPVKSMALTSNPLKLAYATACLTTATWLTGKTLESCGHRYLQCKKIAVRYALELKHDDKDELLNENELLAWSIVEGLSAVPAKWWREITATSISIALFYIGMQNLRN